MKDLITLNGNEIFTDSMVIAKGTNNSHHAVKQMINRYKTEIEEFGTLRISNEESTGGRPLEIILLNEEQATFLITLLRNSKTVVLFKKELVKQFYAMRKFILEKQTTAWVETRQQGKLTRKSETDMIQIFVAYAKEQGSTNADKYYMTFSKLANKMAEIEKRDSATTMQLNNLSLIENIILNQIRVGAAMQKPYKEVYQDCKRQIELFKDIAYIGIG